MVAAFQFGSDYVGVAFSEKVNAAQATTAANYSFSPSLTISSVTMQDNGQTAIIKTSAALPKSTAYTLTVSGVTSLTGGSLSGGTANFTTVAETVVNIATIQNEHGHLLRPVADHARPGVHHRVEQRDDDQRVHPGRLRTWAQRLRR